MAVLFEGFMTMLLRVIGVCNKECIENDVFIGVVTLLSMGPKMQQMVVIMY